MLSINISYFWFLDRTGKSLSESSKYYTHLSPLVSALLENPSLHPGTFYFYNTAGLPAGIPLLKPLVQPSTTTIKNGEGESTTTKSDETTQQEDEDVGEETEPSSGNTESATTESASSTSSTSSENPSSDA